MLVELPQRVDEAGQVGREADGVLGRQGHRGARLGRPLGAKHPPGADRGLRGDPTPEPGWGVLLVAVAGPGPALFKRPGDTGGHVPMQEAGNDGAPVGGDHIAQEHHLEDQEGRAAVHARGVGSDTVVGPQCYAVQALRGGRCTATRRSTHGFK